MRFTFGCITAALVNTAALAQGVVVEERSYTCHTTSAKQEIFTFCTPNGDCDFLRCFVTLDGSGSTSVSLDTCDESTDTRVTDVLGLAFDASHNLTKAFGEDCIRL